MTRQSEACNPRLRDPAVLGPDRLQCRLDLEVERPCPTRLGAWPPTAKSERAHVDEGTLSEHLAVPARGMCRRTSLCGRVVGRVEGQDSLGGSDHGDIDEGAVLHDVGAAAGLSGLGKALDDATG